MNIKLEILFCLSESPIKEVGLLESLLNAPMNKIPVARISYRLKRIRDAISELRRDCWRIEEDNGGYTLHERHLDILRRAFGSNGSARCLMYDWMNYHQLRKFTPERLDAEMIIRKERIHAKR